MEEIWKDVVGYEGLYQVSNLGNVKSLGNNKFKKQTLLKQAINTHGYLICALYKDKKLKTYTTHKLVAIAFLVKKNINDIVNHKDGNKKNNNIKNLEYCSYSQNTIHAYKNGLNKGPQGEKQHASKLKEHEVKEIRKKYFTTRVLKNELAKEYGVSSMTINHIVNYITWKHI